MPKICQARGAQVSGPFPVEWLLVILLYTLLVTEVIIIIRQRYTGRGQTSGLKVTRPPFVASLGNSTKKPCGMCHKKKTIRSLDHLWRRMRQATNQMTLINLRHHVITKVMMESRIEARMHEREKLQRKKQRLLAEVR